MGEELLIEWFSIWGDKIITTSNLALNRAWRQRLPVIQTGYDFVQFQNVNLIEQLHQCPYDKMAKIACEKRDFELFKYCFTSGWDYKFNLSEYVKIIIQNNYSEFFDIFKKSWIMNVEILSKIAYYAAKYGNKYLVKWISEEHIGIPDPIQLLKGAVKHSTEMFEYVCSFLPKPIGITSEILQVPLYKVEFETPLGLLLESGDAIMRLDVEFTFHRSDYLPKILKENIDRFNIFAFGNMPHECSHVAARMGLETLQAISKLVKPDHQTFEIAAECGDKESVQWLLSEKCDSSQVSWGAARHSLDMIKFIHSLEIPIDLTNILREGAYPDKIRFVKWLEHHFPGEIDYGQIYLTAMCRFNPKLSHYVREKANLDFFHISFALQTANFVQLEWILERYELPHDRVISSFLTRIFDLRVWQYAYERKLYPIPVELARYSIRKDILPEPAHDEFRDKAPHIYDWLLKTNQISSSN